jgi:hypothetical protein
LARSPCPNRPTPSRSLRLRVRNSSANSVSGEHAFPVRTIGGALHSRETSAVGELELERCIRCRDSRPDACDFDSAQPAGEIHEVWAEVQEDVILSFVRTP